MYDRMMLDSIGGAWDMLMQQFEAQGRPLPPNPEEMKKKIIANVERAVRSGAKNPYEHMETIFASIHGKLALNHLPPFPGTAGADAGRAVPEAEVVDTNPATHVAQQQQQQEQQHQQQPEQKKGPRPRPGSREDLMDFLAGHEVTSLEDVPGFPEELKTSKNKKEKDLSRKMMELSLLEEMLEDARDNLKMASKERTK